MDLGFEKHQYLDDVYKKAINWLNKQGEWRGAAMKNMGIGMNVFNERSIEITKQDILNAEARSEFHSRYRDKNDILNMGENKYPDIKRGDNFEYGGEYYVFDRYDSGDGAHIFKNSLGQDKKVAGGPISDFNKIDPSQNMIDINTMDDYMKSSYDLFSARQYHGELLRTKGQEAADEFFQDVINPLSNQVKTARENLDAGLNRKHNRRSYTENIKDLLDWESEVHGQMVTQGRWKKNTSNTGTTPSGPQPTGPQPGDQFYDPKRKRQYVYEGPDDVFEGKHSFISDQGRTFVGSFDDLEKFTDESRFLDLDEMKGYRNAIDNMDTYLGNVHHGGHTLKNEFWEEAQKAVKEVEAYENKVKKRIKHHRMETGVNNNRKVLKNYINDWKNKHNNTNTNTNTNRNTNTNTNTNRDPNAYEQAKNHMGSGDTIDLNTGDIRKADGTIIKKDGTIIKPQPEIDPDLEDMDGGPDWDGGANDFDQGAYYEEDIPETDAPSEEDWFPEHEGADDVPFGAEDFDDEFLANLTDDQILEQAQTNEELERYIKMRDDARTRLGMDSQTFNAETESRTINNNNFNGVNQERQQQGRNNQQQQRGNQEHKIDQDKPWTWTDDDIKVMADGDPDAAADLMNQREQARQQQQQGQNQQRQTQEQTKNTAEETTGDTGGSSKETPKGNIDEETLKKRKIERQQRSDRVRHANRKLKGKPAKHLKNRSKGAIRRLRKKSNDLFEKKKKGLIGKDKKIFDYNSKKFKVKGGNLKQVVANTIVNEVIEEVAEEAAENILHPNMFSNLDQFADMSDDDIQHFVDMIENEECSVKVLETHDRWHGVTCREDHDIVVKAFAKLVNEKAYPDNF